MKKGTNIWRLIVILAVLGSVLSGMAGAANKSAADSAVNVTEEINNVTNATISNLNETLLDNFRINQICHHPKLDHIYIG